MIPSEATVDWSDITPESPPLLIVMSGPSGVGKDAVLTAMKKQGVPLHYTVTVTTRPRRSNEVDGVDYFFVSPEKFAELRDRGELLEWAVVHGNLYGTPIGQIRQALRSGRDVLLKIDVQGASKVKQRIPEAVFIFLAPPSLEELMQRLCGRGTETEADLRRRISDAREEMRHLPEYDYVVVNREGRLADTVDQVKCIIKAEKLRLRPRKIEL
ncbi:MAG: guanylate kinase [Chloroflexota bacterium]|mgnify:FL=1